MEVATDIAAGNAEHPRCRDKDMGEILTDAAPDRKRFCGGGRRVRRVGVERDLAIESRHQRVKKRQSVAIGAGPHRSREIDNCSIGMRQRRLAQEELRRKPFDRAIHQPVGILCIDITIDCNR